MVDVAFATAKLREETTKIESLVATARRLLDSGRLVDLAALEGRTKSLCDNVLNLPAAEAVTFKPALNELLAALDGLTDALNARFGDLPRIEIPSHSDAAAAAYGQALKHFP